MARRPNPRAAAQRATAKRVREARAGRVKYQKLLPKSITSRITTAQVEQANRWADGTDPMPAPGTLEARQAARMASLSRWGKADPRFYDLLKQYFYHDEKKQDQNEADVEESADYDSEDEDEEAE